MKPLRLELRGFTAFRETAVVEFGARRLFVITGPTGAGKSSLLDAITWALYGQVPRVGTATLQLITHGERSMAVRFDFTARGETYRVSRHAPATTGTRLERLTADGAWTPVSDRARDVTAQVTQILGLDYQTFTRTIVLPQGAFDSFLRGDEKGRRAILSRLLGLDTYEAVRRAAQARAKHDAELGDALNQLMARLTLAAPGTLQQLERECGQLETSAAAFAARRQSLAALRTLARAAEEAQRALDATSTAVADAASGLATAEHAGAQSAAALADTQQRRHALAAERTRLDYDVGQHQRLRERVATLRRRDAARTAAAAAVQALAEADTGQRRALDVVQRRHAQRSAAATALADAERALAAAAAGAEAVARRLRREAEEAESAREAAITAAAAGDRRAQALQSLATRAEEAARQQVATQQTAAKARRALATAERAHAATVRALHDAEATLVARREALDAARVRDAAAALRHVLKPGDPCPVCGEPLLRIPPAVAVDIDEASAACQHAERDAAAARAQQAESSTRLVRTTASAEHAQDALDAAIVRLTEIDAAVAAQRVERAQLAAAVAVATAEAAAARHAATAQQR
ncbi:MAG: SMC family ATPase, partial [Dehalococcoidia bacterium]|nr:SMC family ATPase [Dehalococcoidia bacterium]